MISVCITNFNYARFLRHAIDSALALQQETDVEVVVVDDGSTDESREIIASYGTRIRPVLKPNGGQGSAFNRGFAAAEGDIIMFLDADDMARPGLGSALQSAFAADPRPVRVQTRMAIVDADGVPTGEEVPTRAQPYAPTDLRRHVRRFRSYPWPPSSANAYDAAALRLLLPLPEAAYPTACDSYLAELMPWVGPMTSLDVIGVAYRVHASNTYHGTGVDLAWLRRKLGRVVDNHQRALALTGAHGVAGPLPDPLDALDVAFLGYRMASLRLDPAGHPFAGDHPLGLLAAGVRAALANPFLGPRDRVVRAVWFALAGLLPRSLAAAVVHRFVPDSPSRLRRVTAPRT